MDIFRISLGEDQEQVSLQFVDKAKLKLDEMKVQLEEERLAFDREKFKEKLKLDRQKFEENKQLNRNRLIALFTDQIGNLLNRIKRIDNDGEAASQTNEELRKEAETMLNYFWNEREGLMTSND